MLERRKRSEFFFLSKPEPDFQTGSGWLQLRNTTGTNLYGTGTVFFIPFYSRKQLRE